MPGTSSLLARVPLAGLVLGCFAGIFCAVWSCPGWMLALLIPGAFLVWRGASVQVGLALLGWLLMWGMHGARLQNMGDLEARLVPGDRLELEVVVGEVREPGGFHPEAMVEVRSGEGVGGRLGLRGLPMQVRPGDCLRVTGRVRFAEAARNPGVLDRVEMQRRSGLGGELWVERMEVLDERAMMMWPRRVAWDLRGVVRERIVMGLEEGSLQAALIRALVLGERDGNQMEAFDSFRHSGTMHVFAVSGLHVGMIGLLAWGLLRLLRVPRWWGIWVVLGVMWGYAMVTGLRPPAMRAALMATVFLAGFVVRRDPVLGNALLASLPLVLLGDSFQWQQPGFQLSYLVVASIIVVSPMCLGLARPWWQGDPFLPRVLYTRTQRFWGVAREKVGSLAVVSFSAWLGSLPLMWGHFGLVTPAAVVASLVLVPMVFVILGLAIVGLLGGVIWEPLEVGINRVNGSLVTGAHHLARSFAAVPGSHFEVGEGRWWGDGLLVFDLRDGDGAAYFGGDGGLLIDTGGRREFGRVVFPAMRKSGVQPRALVVSHPDGGHCGGAPGAVRAWPVEQILLPVREALSPSFRELREVAEVESAEEFFADSGSRYPLADGAELEVLYSPGEGEGSLADDRCLVLRIHWKGWRILLSNDAGFEIEQRLLARGVDLRSDVWIMGRHQTDFSGSDQFLEAVSPQVIVASHRHFPIEERIPARWADWVEGNGISLWRQNETGAVAIEAVGDGLRLRSFLDDGRTETLRKP